MIVKYFVFKVEMCVVLKDTQFIAWSDCSLWFYIVYPSLKSNSHAPNLHACIIYIRVNILLVYIFVHANANTHES